MKHKPKIGKNYGSTISLSLSLYGIHYLRSNPEKSYETEHTSKEDQRKCDLLKYCNEIVLLGTVDESSAHMNLKFEYICLC